MAEIIAFCCPNPNCKTPIRVSAEHAGKEGKCPKCRQVARIPIPTRTPEHPVPAPRVAVAEPVIESRGTDVNTWLAGFYGSAATMIFYLVVAWPLSSRGHYLGKLMMERGWVQYAITLVTCWGAALLLLKYLAVRRELRAADYELKLIPLGIGLQITSSNVAEFLGNLAKLPPADQSSILTSRIRGALKYFQVRGNASEVQTYLSAQAELAASAVDQGYTLLRVFIWVCPILGFIGTVTGISDAVTDLARTLPDGSDAAEAADLGSKMLVGMQGVTKGLSVAFDTTFLGLICVVLLMFPCEMLKKVEYAMLDWVEEFTHEALLRRITDEVDPSASGDMPLVVRRTMESAFLEHQRWLAVWQVQVGELGQKIGADVEAGISRARDAIAAAAATELNELARLQSATRRSEEVLASLATEQARARVEFEAALTDHSQSISTALADATRSGRMLASELVQAADRLSQSVSAALRTTPNATTSPTEGVDANRLGAIVAVPPGAGNRPPIPLEANGKAGWLRFFRRNSL